MGCPPLLTGVVVWKAVNPGVIIEGRSERFAVGLRRLLRSPERIKAQGHAFVGGFIPPRGEISWKGVASVRVRAKRQIWRRFPPSCSELYPVTLSWSHQRDWDMLAG